MKYSDRIQTIINMIRPCQLLADIGCDHGYVCIEAVRGGSAKAALACDIKGGPLAAASENIRNAGLEDCIRTVLSDVTLLVGNFDVTSAVAEAHVAAQVACLERFGF